VILDALSKNLPSELSTKRRTLVLANEKLKIVNYDYYRYDHNLGTGTSSNPETYSNGN